jgi:tetratricopeptide (TPR) repeat protein
LVYADVKEHERALADFTHAIRLDPAWKVLYLNRATIYHRLGQTDSALADINQVLALDAEYGAAYGARGEVELTRNNYTNAVADFSRALELGVKEANVYKGRGDAFRRLGKVTEAIGDYDAALAVNPKYDPYIFFYKAMCYQKVGFTVDAIANYKLFIQNAPPDNPDIATAKQVIRQLGGE